MKKKNMKWFAKLAAAVCCVAMLGAMVVNPMTAKADEAANDVVTGKTAAEIVEAMGPGFNIGNSLDATGGDRTYVYGQEGSWGNPRIREELLDGIKAAGFTSLRIPTSWFKQMDYNAETGKYEVNKQFMDRVKEVVDYAYNLGLYVILNTHHEDFTEGDKSVKNVVENSQKICDLWTQISNEFANYDQRLIFESMNEPREGEKWSGNGEAHAAFNYMNEVFVNAVRCNGKGYNSERCLMIPGYAASPDSLSAVNLPTYNGEVCNNLIVSVHSYTPYNFCLQDADTTFDEQDKKDIDYVFAKIKKTMLDYNIPVVMGETGATNSGGNTAERVKWATYFASVSASYGIPCLIWDNGVDSGKGGESHSYINRTTGAIMTDYESVTRAFIDTYKSTAYGSALTPKEEATGTPNVSYYGNAGMFYSGMEEKIGPTILAQTFEGWYTTPDYKPGTELDLENLTGPTNAYAKYSLDLEMYGLKPYTGKSGSGEFFNALGTVTVAGIVIPVLILIATGVAVLAIAVVVVLVVVNNKKKKAAA